MAGWIVGPLAATVALFAIGFVWLGLYASGGGLVIAGMVAFWTGAGAAALADPRRQGRNAAIVAVYLLVLFAVCLLILQSRPAPPGTSYGGPNEMAPR